MAWNYRIILHDMDPDRGRHFFGLHEVYYDGPGGKVTGWTENPISFSCAVDEGHEGIIRSMELALNDAKQRPILRERELWKQIGR